MSLEITRYNMYGRQVTIDIHNLNLPDGTLAHRLESRTCRQMRKMGITDMPQFRSPGHCRTSGNDSCSEWCAATV